MRSFSIASVLFSILVFSTGCASQPQKVEAERPAEKAAEKTLEKAVSKDAWAAQAEEKPVAKKKEEADPYALVTCANGMETRTMAIAPHGEDGQGCELRYEKNEKNTSVPAYSSFGMGHCLAARDKMKANLLKAGWKCAQ